MEKYENLGLIGEGSYGMVWKCRNKESGQMVAVKKFLESEEDRQVKKIAMREIKMLKHLHHENLVNLIEVFRRKKRLYLVFEYVDQTLLHEMEKHSRGMPVAIVRRHLWQICAALQFCHSHNVIHRDLKPENVLVSRSGIVKLCDFGFARTLAGPGEIYTDYVATRWYRSPELLVGDPNYGTPVDVWALGCLFYEMMTADPLFPGDSDLDQLHHILKCFGPLPRSQVEIFMRNALYQGVRLPEPRERITLQMRLRAASVPHVIEFLEVSLVLDPSERWTAEKLMNHAFFTHDSFHQQFPEELALKLKKGEPGIEKKKPSLSSLTPMTKKTSPKSTTPECDDDQKLPQSQSQTLSQSQSQSQPQTLSQLQSQPLFHESSQSDHQNVKQKVTNEEIIVRKTAVQIPISSFTVSQPLSPGSAHRQTTAASKSRDTVTLPSIVPSSMSKKTQILSSLPQLKMEPLHPISEGKNRKPEVDS